MVDPFTTYRIYSSIQLHFTSPKYDYTKTRRPVGSFSAESFEKRRDRYQFQKLGRNFTDVKSLEEFCACLFFANKGKVWIGEANPDDLPLYTAYRAYMGARGYFFKRSLNNLSEIYGSMKECLQSHEASMPGIVNEVLSDEKEGNIVTFTLIDRSVNIMNLYDDRYMNGSIGPIYERLVLPIRKFKNFVSLNSMAELEEIRGIFRDSTTKQSI